MRSRASRTIHDQPNVRIHASNAAEGSGACDEVGPCHNDSTQALPVQPDHEDGRKDECEEGQRQAAHESHGDTKVGHYDRNTAAQEYDSCALASIAHSRAGCIRCVASCTFKRLEDGDEWQRKRKQRIGGHEDGDDEAGHRAEIGSDDLFSCGAEGKEAEQPKQGFGHNIRGEHS